MELSIDRGCPNAHSTPVNPSTAARRPGYARGRLIPSVAERLQPTTPFSSYGATLPWNARAADRTSQPRSRKTSRPGTALASHAPPLRDHPRVGRHSGRLTRTRVEFSRGMMTTARKRALPVRGKDRSPPDHHNSVRRTCFLPVNADLGRRKGSSPCR